MLLKDIKNLNQEHLALFNNWISSLPHERLSCLNPESFAYDTRIDYNDAVLLFLKIKELGYLDVIFNTKCPNCKNICTIEYGHLSEEFECDECFNIFIPYEYIKYSETLFKINYNMLSKIPSLYNKKIDLTNMVLQSYKNEVSPNNKGKIIDINSKTQKRVKVFFSYSHKDEEMRNELDTHLIMLKRLDYIESWFDGKINAGEKIDENIKRELVTSDIVLLMLSPDFIASYYCYEIEMQVALEREKSGEAVVIPIILRPCDWQNTVLKDLKALPTDAKPVSTWDNKDQVYLSIKNEIQKIVDTLNN